MTEKESHEEKEITKRIKEQNNIYTTKLERLYKESVINQENTINNLIKKEKHWYDTQVQREIINRCG